jgi:hypothetical protein
VPVCSTVGVPSPSRPTQNEENVLAAPQVTAGCTQEADTWPNEPAGPVAAYPAQFWLATAVTLDPATALAAFPEPPGSAEPPVFPEPPAPWAPDPGIIG